MRGINDSYVEQLHAVQRALGLTIQSTAKPKTMLLLQLLQHDTFVKKADKAGVPKEKRHVAGCSVRTHRKPSVFR